jgi:hypothetical protein
VLAQIVPHFGAQLFTARQWCVRRAGESAVVSFSPNLSVEIAALEMEHEPPEAEVESPHPLDISSLLNHPNESRTRC